MNRSTVNQCTRRRAIGRRTRRAVAGLAVVALMASAPAAWAEATNRIVARVNDRIATLYDYETRLEDAMRREREVPSEPAARDDFLRGIARDVMRDMLEELLILSRADQLDVTVTANQVTESINRMRKTQGLEDDTQYREALAQAGLTPEVLRAQFESQIRSNQVVQREVWGEVNLEEEDLRRYYRDHIDEFRTPEQVKLREVVVLDDTGASPAAAATADALAATLAAGKTLEDATAALPTGTVSSIIQLGWVEEGDLDAALEKAVWTLPVNAWSPPTRARGGIHLVQVLERRESSVPAFKDIEAQIEQRMHRERIDARMKDYLAELEKKSYLYLDPPPQAAGFRAESEGSTGREFPFIVPSETAAAGEGGKGKDKAAKAKKTGEDAGATAGAADEVDKAAAGAVEAAEEAAGGDADAGADAGAEEGADGAAAAAAREKARAEAEKAEEEAEDLEEIEEWPPKPQTAPAPVPPPSSEAPDDPEETPSDSEVTPPPGSGARR